MALKRYQRHPVYFWPHAGVALGLLLNMVGLATKNADLIGTGSNLLTISGLFLVERRRNERRQERRKEEE